MEKIKMARQNEITLSEAFERFIRKCKIKNLTPKTIISYKENTSNFFLFYGADSKVSLITENTIDEYVLWLKENRNCNDSSINSYLRTLRALLYFCMDNEYVTRFKIRLIKAEKKIKETYTNEELEILLRKPDSNTCSFREYQIWVLENYLLATGNRISSALNVRIEDIDFKNNYIYIRKTKNRSQQIIPLSQTLSYIISDYLQIRGGEGEDYLFCNVYGGKPYEHTFQQAIRTYNRKRGIEKTSAHLFRATFAKNWILAGGDIFRLQKVLGHSDLTVTKEYVAMFGADLQMDFEKFNPLDRMNNKINKDKIKM